jgi:hypothetical protein
MKMGHSFSTSVNVLVEIVRRLERENIDPASDSGTMDTFMELWRKGNQQEREHLRTVPEFSRLIDFW